MEKWLTSIVTILFIVPIMDGPLCVQYYCFLKIFGWGCHEYFLTKHKQKINNQMKRTVFIAVAILLLSIGWYWRHHAQQTQQKKVVATPISVSTSPVIQRNVIEQIQAVGTVQAYSTVSIVPQVSGELISVGFKQGDLVQQGQLLFQIDPKPYQAQLDQVEANLQRDQAQLDNARTLVERNQKLVPKGYISRSDFDQLVSNEKALMGTIKADQAAVETAKLQLGYATIRAPIAGRTGNLLVHPGNIVTANNANEPLVVINQIEPIYVAFSVPEQRMLAIQREYSSSQSMPVTAIIDSKEGSVEVKGDLSFIDNTVDATTGTIQLKATFANADHLLWPGRFVTVKLPVTPIANALLVPTQAIQAGQQGSFIYVLGPENKAVYRPVTLGPVIDDNTVVIQGVKLGEQVITTGQFNLAEGVVVQVVNPKTTTITVDEKP